MIGKAATGGISKLSRDPAVLGYLCRGSEVAAVRAPQRTRDHAWFQQLQPAEEAGEFLATMLTTLVRERRRYLGVGTPATST